MGLKIAIISFFLILLTMMMVMWVNSIPAEQITQPKNPQPSGQIERIKVGPTSSPQELLKPEPTSDEVLGVASSSAASKKICQSKCGDDICQLIVCKGSSCPCAENDVICPQDCR